MEAHPLPLLLLLLLLPLLLLLLLFFFFFRSLSDLSNTTLHVCLLHPFVLSALIVKGLHTMASDVNIVKCHIFLLGHQFITTPLQDPVV